LLDSSVRLQSHLGPPQILYFLIRSSKSASSWTDNELQCYRITIAHQGSAAFFGQVNLPQPQINDNDILTGALIGPNAVLEDMDDDTYSFLRTMHLATRLDAEESIVDQLSCQLFRTLGFVGFAQRRVIMQRKILHFQVCAMERAAIPNICFIDGNDIIRLIQENKRLTSSMDPAPQLIAQAIAAFSHNNSVRDEQHLALLQSEVILGITMVRTTPTFYKIRVSRDLVDAVRDGTYPQSAHATTVFAHRPFEVVLNNNANNDALAAVHWENLDDRLGILSCFEAFKAFL